MEAVRSYSCSYCQKNFPLLSALKQHRISTHSVDTFICKLCQSLFAKKVDLQSHLMKSHSAYLVSRNRLTRKHFKLHKHSREEYDHTLNSTDPKSVEMVKRNGAIGDVNANTNSTLRKEGNEMSVLPDRTELSLDFNSSDDYDSSKSQVMCSPDSTTDAFGIAKSILTFAPQSDDSKDSNVEPKWYLGAPDGKIEELEVSFEEDQDHLQKCELDKTSMSTKDTDDIDVTTTALDSPICQLSPGDIQPEPSSTTSPLAPSVGNSPASEIPVNEELLGEHILSPVVSMPADMMEKVEATTNDTSAVAHVQEKAFVDDVGEKAEENDVDPKSAKLSGTTTKSTNLHIPKKVLKKRDSNKKLSLDVEKEDVESSNEQDETNEDLESMCSSAGCMPQLEQMPLEPIACAVVGHQRMRRQSSKDMPHIEKEMPCIEAEFPVLERQTSISPDYRRSDMKEELISSTDQESPNSTGTDVEPAPPDICPHYGPSISTKTPAATAAAAVTAGMKTQEKILACKEEVDPAYYGDEEEPYTGSTEEEEDDEDDDEYEEESVDEPKQEHIKPSIGLGSNRQRNESPGFFDVFASFLQENYDNKVLEPEENDENGDENNVQEPTKKRDKKLVKRTKNHEKKNLERTKKSKLVKPLKPITIKRKSTSDEEEEEESVSHLGEFRVEADPTSPGTVIKIKRMSPAVPVAIPTPEVPTVLPTPEVPTLQQPSSAESTAKKEKSPENKISAEKDSDQKPVLKEIDKKSLTIYDFEDSDSAGKCDERETPREAVASGSNYKLRKKKKVPTATLR